MRKNTDSKVEEAKPLDPIKAILDIFDSYPLVAISEGRQHGDEQGHAFLRSLISDVRFADIVNDIVVEWGNTLYQEVIDQFVEGIDVPYEILQQVWQNTTQPHDVWDKPVYEEFFRTIRKINDALPKMKKLRVLLGEPPINWNTVQSKEDVFNFYKKRDSYPADLIQNEVINKKRRALIIYGGMHLQRMNLYSNYEESTHELLVSLLVKKGLEIFTIWGAFNLEKLQPNISSWEIPALTIIRDTLLGDIDFTEYYPYEIERRVIRNGDTTSLTREQWRTLRMEEQFDAIMYYGPDSSITYSQVLPITCSDQYINMRINRMTLAGLPQSEVDKKIMHYKKLKNQLQSD